MISCQNIIQMRRILTKPISLDFMEAELPEEAVDAGLLEASFFKIRVLSMPFSRGEWAGLARGDEGSLMDQGSNKDIQYVINLRAVNVYPQLESFGI